jgi:GT2 family glycosyltransferase
MNNPVLMLVHNCLELTKRSIGSVLEQDIPVTLYVVDNASGDMTRQWLNDNGILHWRREVNGVSSGWNFGFNYLFDVAKAEHVFCVNNDIVLRPDTYRLLLEEQENDFMNGGWGGFVTCVSVGDVAQLEWDGVRREREHPDFSAFLIDSITWQKIGRFDESMTHYCSDGDYHIRMKRARINAYTIGIPFYHYASGTLKNAPEAERLQISEQADRDRKTFRQKWGVDMGSPEYYSKFFNGSAPE